MKQELEAVALTVMLLTAGCVQKDSTVEEHRHKRAG